MNPNRFARWKFAVLAGAIGLFVAWSSAASAAPLKQYERAFVERAGRFVYEQVVVSEIAVARATNEEVKELAKTILSDQMTAQAILSGIAASRGVKITVRTDPAKWSKKTQRDFDRDYVAKMVTDQKDALPLFAKESKDGRDSNITAFARQFLPRVQQHLEVARRLEKTVK
jgi:putative membrane protein